MDLRPKKEVLSNSLHKQMSRLRQGIQLYASKDMNKGLPGQAPTAHLSVGGSMSPGDSACARLGAPIVSAMRAVPVPVTDTMSPAPAAAMSMRPVPRRFQILVSFASSGAPPGFETSHVPLTV